MIMLLGDDFGKAMIVPYETDFIDPNDVCDALWEAVKAVLEA